MKLIDANKLIEKLSANLDNPEEFPVISLGTVMRMIDGEEEIHISEPEAPCYLGSPCEYQNPNAEIQEERTKTHAETHACDLISKQASEPTLEQVELYCKRRCLTVITDEMLAKLIEERDSILAEAIPVSWITAQIERLKGMDNLFADLTADIIQTTLNEWRKELEGKTT